MGWDLLNYKLQRDCQTRTSRTTTNSKLQTREREPEVGGRGGVVTERIPLEEDRLDGKALQLAELLLGGDLNEGKELKKINKKS